jgi:long-subunit acyl-CoA synthetase (AMP-forming)
VPAENASFAQIEHAINQTNQGLPDYARITEWLPANSPFTVQNQQLTSNGRLKRDVIWQQYQEQINAQYTETTH